MALLVGNTLYNNEEKELFFNWDIKNFEHIFDLIRNWNFVYQAPAPVWGSSLLKGINMTDNTSEIILSGCRLFGIDFSYSYFKKLIFTYADIRNSQFFNLRSTNSFNIAFAIIDQNVLFPIQCAWLLNSEEPSRLCNFGAQKTYIGGYVNGTLVIEISCLVNTLKGLFIYGLKKGLFSIKDIKSWFEFETQELEEKFFKEMGDLSEYQVLKIEIQSDGDKPETEELI